MIAGRFRRVGCSGTVLFSLAISSFSFGRQDTPAGAGDPKDDVAGSYIQSSWSKSTNGLSIRLNPSAKKRWGIKEVPVFSLEVRNDSVSDWQISSAKTQIRLLIGNRQYEFTPDAVVASTVRAKSIDRRTILLRLDEGDWTLKDIDDVEKLNSSSPLKALKVGENEIEIQVSLDEVGVKEKRSAAVLSSGKTKIVITEKRSELPVQKSVLLDSDGKPLAGALIFPCADGQFTAQYSNWSGDKFENLSAGSFFGIEMGAIKSKRIEPIVTGDNGEFELRSGADDKRIVVVTQRGTAQTFDFPESPNRWKVQLERWGDLKINGDIVSDKSIFSTWFQCATQLGEPMEKGAGNRLGNFNFLRETLRIDIKNGQEYFIKNVRPGSYVLSGSKKQLIDGRSFDFGRVSQLFQIEKNSVTTIGQILESGQKIRFKVSKIPADARFVVAEIMPYMDVPDTKLVGSLNAIWSEVIETEASDRTIHFTSGILPAERVRLIVRAMSDNPAKNSYPFAPVRVGSRVIEIGKKGAVDIGGVELHPVEKWRNSSDVLLHVQLIDKAGDATGRMRMYPVFHGYTPTAAGRAVFSDGKGLVKSFRSPGVHKYVLGDQENRTTFFNVRVPAMTKQTVVVSDKATWAENAALAPQLEIVAKISEENMIKVLVKNQGDADYTMPATELRLFVHTVHGWGLRCFPKLDEGDTVVQFESGSETELEYDWKALLAKGYWTSFGVPDSAIFKEIPAGRDCNKALIKIGPIPSNAFYIPLLPGKKVILEDAR